ncbi:MAG: hypothetical protein ACOVN6_00890 [Rhodoluna sp.]|mgnify:FL=1|jgi:hypothetical protein
MRQSNALRAAVSLGVGLFITFSQLHNATIGLLALAIFSLGFAITNSLGSIVWGKGLVAIEAMPLTVVSLLVGVFALMAMSGESAQTAFIGLVTVWGLVSGAFELYLARRASIKSTEGREFLMSAILSATLGLLFLVAPLDIVSAVGFFGAYLIVSGVQLGVAAATPSSSK